MRAYANGAVAEAACLPARRRRSDLMSISSPSQRKLFWGRIPSLVVLDAEAVRVKLVPARMAAHPERDFLRFPCQQRRPYRSPRDEELFSILFQRAMASGVP